MTTFRKATINDIDELIELRISFIKEHQGNISKSNLNILKKNLSDYFYKNIPTGNFIAWLALDDNKIISTSGLCFFNPPPTIKNLNGKNAYIMNMYTIPEYRKQGIAKKLLIKLLKEIDHLQIDFVSLNASEKGINLYRQFGFSEPDDPELVLNIKTANTKHFT